MKSIRICPVAFFAVSAWLFAVSVLPAHAQNQPARVLVRAVHGSASCSINGNWQSLKENTTLATGAIIKTAPDTTLDLFLPDSRTVLRLMPGSTLRFDRLDKMPAGEMGFTFTRLSLLSGALIGSQHKLVRPSVFEVGLPNAVAKIVGTEYSMQADGTVVCMKGAVSVAYNLAGNGPAVNVSVPAGYSSDPATGTTAATSSTYLQNIASDLQAVLNNDATFNAAQTSVVVPDNCGVEVTPIHGRYPYHPYHPYNHDHDHDHGNGYDNGHGGGNGNDQNNGNGDGNGNGGW